MGDAGGGEMVRERGSGWEEEDKADRWSPPISDSHEEKGRGAGGAQCRPVRRVPGPGKKEGQRGNRP